MATATPEAVRVSSIPRITDSPEALKELRDGMAGAVAELRVPELQGLEPICDHAEHPALRPYDVLIDAAVDDVLAQTADLLTAAVNRRLPWMWEPDR